MKRFHRTFVLAASFLSLALLLVANKLPIVGQSAPGSSEQIAAPRPASDSILLAVTVNDKKGNPIGGLDKTAFTIYENKIPQEISFFSAKDEPASVGVIFDLSGSLAGTARLRAARNAVLRFIELSHSENHYFVIAFANRAVLLIDWTRDSKAAAVSLSKYYFTKDNASKVPLNTALYDACYLGVEKMTESAHSRQALILITDGQDNNSRYTFSEVRQRLKETQVVLYSIGILGGNDPGSSMGMEGQAVMDELSWTSGGKAFFPNAKEGIDLIFDRILLQLRHQYLIGFKPSEDKADGKWHKIKIKVSPPLTAEGRRSDLYVRSREGYYAARNLR